MTDKISHGRGGKGNIGPDATKYADGEITRVGAIGDQGDGPFSAGRGGAGNISATALSRREPADKDIVPVSAMKMLDKEESHHYGRGGAGNETHVHEKKHHHHNNGEEGKHEEGFAEKLKHKILGGK